MIEERSNCNFSHILVRHKSNWLLAASVDSNPPAGNIEPKNWAQPDFHEEIGSEEFVPMHPFARLARDRCDRYLLVHFGHVTRLATALAGIIAMEPFEVWHLLGKSADLFPARPESLGVQSVASTTQRRVENVRRHDSAISTAAAFVVESGRPGAHKA